MDYNIENFKNSISNYITKHIDNNNNVSLTKLSSSSPFALCFAIHTLFLVKNIKILKEKENEWINLLENNLITASKYGIYSKSFQQLLTLTISSFIILNNPKNEVVINFSKKLIPKNMNTYLNQIGVHKGLPGSGNMSMFVAIFCIYNQKYYNIDCQNEINSWLLFHKNNLNSYGLWGNVKNFQYSLFQNGYHQYEIFNYLNYSDIPILQIKNNVLKLQDNYGHFSSIPGGTGCHDYDAIFFLTYKCEEHIQNNIIRDALIKTKKRIIQIQHRDGGYSESLFVRPLNLKNLKRQIEHVKLKNINGRKERISRFIANLRPKNSKLKNHWSNYKRNWNETNIFNTWFKVLTVAKIEKYLDRNNNKWGFLNFPGIGFDNE